MRYIDWRSEISILLLSFLFSCLHLHHSTSCFLNHNAWLFSFLSHILLLDNKLKLKLSWICFHINGYFSFCISYTISSNYGTFLDAQKLFREREFFFFQLLYLNVLKFMLMIRMGKLFFLGWSLGMSVWLSLFLCSAYKLQM